MCFFGLRPGPQPSTEEPQGSATLGQPAPLLLWGRNVVEASGCHLYCLRSEGIKDSRDRNEYQVKDNHLLPSRTQASGCKPAQKGAAMPIYCLLSILPTPRPQVIEGLRPRHFLANSLAIPRNHHACVSWHGLLQACRQFGRPACNASGGQHPKHVLVSSRSVCCRRQNA